MAFSATGGGGGKKASRPVPNYGRNGGKTNPPKPKPKPKLLPPNGYKQSYKSTAPKKSPNSPIPALTKALTSPGTGVAKPANKTPLTPPALKAAPKPAPKAAPRQTLTGRSPVGGSAPIVAGGGKSPAMGAPVAGGGAKPATPQAVKDQKVSNTNAVNKMQAFIDQAKGTIGAQDLPALNELQRQLDSINEVYGKQKNETIERGKRMESDLAELFGRLGNFTQNVKTTTDSQFQALRGQTGDTYSALQGQLGKTFGAAKSDTEAELARMGMSGQAPNATADITRDSAYLQGLAGADSAHNQNAFSLQQGGFDQLMAMAMGNAATEGTVQIGRAKRDTERTLADLMFELNQSTRDVSGRRGDILATQGQRTTDLARALEEQDFARRTSEEQRQFNNRIALDRLGMEKESHQLGMMPQPVDYADTLRTTLLQLDVEDKLAQQTQAQKDREWQQAFNKLWPNAPGKRS